MPATESRAIGIRTHSDEESLRKTSSAPSVENPESAPDGKTFIDYLNPASLEVIPNAQAEPSLAGSAEGTRVQFERLGYFCVDSDSRPGALVFNRTVSLRDAWAKIANKKGS